MSGLRAQIGWGAEASNAYATPVAISTFLPLISESVARTRDPIITPGLIGGRRFPTVGQFELGPQLVSGQVTFDLHTQNIETLLRLMIGGNPTGSGTSPTVTRVYTPGVLASATVEIVRPISLTAADQYVYAGTMASGWSLSVSAGQIAQLSLDLVAQSETLTAAGTGTAIALPSDMSRYKWDQVAVTFSSVASNCVTSLTISGNNGLTTDELCLGSSVIAQPREDNHREYTVDMTLRNPGAGANTPMARRGEIVTATVALSIDAQRSLTFSLGNLLVVNATTNVGGPGRVEQQVQCRMLGSAAADSGAISATLISALAP